MNQDFIYLASASPRRQELLRQIGVPFRVLPADLPEVRAPHEPVEDFVLRMARNKAGSVLARTTDMPQPVLGADTVVVVEGEMLGKPEDRDSAIAMLRRLSGRDHHVYTAVAVTDGGRTRALVDVSRVWFRDLGRDEMMAYWATGEPADKAGAYAVQGIGAAFVRRIEGSFSGVMGLPLFVTAALLAEFGRPLPGLAGSPAHA